MIASANSVIDNGDFLISFTEVCEVSKQDFRVRSKLRLEI